ncbi:PEGA domain-containing protein [Corallococcus sp. 4LFB]|uniref:PEGA domain-containing protein n=1 Tax=Corallococcus sp. 4LFB TaxID=3383249 RepID=UPI003975953E
MGAVIAAAVLFFVGRAVMPDLSEPRSRKLQVVSSPPGAEVRWDGQHVGMTPTVLDVASGEDSHKLELRFVGYQPWATTVSQAAVPERVQVSLERLPPPPPPPEPVVDARVPEPRQAGSRRQGVPRLNAQSESREALDWIENAPSAGAEYTLGVELLVAGKDVQAGQKFGTCLRLLEAAAECHLGMGRVSARTARAGVAVEHYRRYLQLRPRGAGAAEARQYLKSRSGR